MGAGNASLYALSRVLAALFGDRVRIVKYYFAAQPVIGSRRRRGRARSRFQWALPWLAALLAGRAAACRAHRAIRTGRSMPRRNGRDTELAGFLWFVMGPYDEDEVRVRFIPRRRARRRGISMSPSCLDSGWAGCSAICGVARASSSRVGCDALAVAHFSVQPGIARVASAAGARIVGNACSCASGHGN